MELTRVKKYPFWQIKCDRKETTSSERLTRKEQNISLIMKTHSNNICKCKPHNVNMWEMSRKWELFRKRKYWESESCWDSESDWKSRNNNYLLKWLGHLSAVAVWACARCLKWWHLWSNPLTLLKQSHPGFNGLSCLVSGLQRSPSCIYLWGELACLKKIQYQHRGHLCMSIHQKWKYYRETDPALLNLMWIIFEWVRSTRRGWPAKLERTSQTEEVSCRWKIFFSSTSSFIFSLSL